jgi:hypothetical protein
MNSPSGRCWSSSSLFRSIIDENRVRRSKLRLRFPEDSPRVIYKTIKELKSLGMTVALAGKLTPAPFDFAMCMYFTGIDTFTK